MKSKDEITRMEMESPPPMDPLDNSGSREFWHRQDQSFPLQHSSTVPPPVPPRRSIHQFDRQSSLAPSAEALDPRHSVSPPADHSAVAGFRSDNSGSQVLARVRQQTKKLVDRRRGSAQMKRRMMRSASSTTTDAALSVDNEVGRESDNAAIQEEEFFTGDEQIQNALEIGSKHVALDQNLFASEHAQRRFFLGTDIDKRGIFDGDGYGEQEINGEEKRQLQQSTMDFAERNEFFAKPTVWETSAQCQQKLKQILTFRPPLQVKKPGLGGRSIEDPQISSMDELTVRNTVARWDFMGQKAEEDSSSTLSADYISLGDFFPPISFSASAEEERRYRWIRLDLDLSRVEFHHHWLFSERDRAMQNARVLNDRSVAVNEKALGRIQLYLTLTTQNQDDLQKSDKDQGSSTNFEEDVLAGLLNEISQLHGKALQLNVELERAWLELQQAYAETTPPMALRRLPALGGGATGADGILQDVPIEIRNFFQLQMVLLNELEPVPAPSSQQSSTRVSKQLTKAASKCSYKVRVLFNGVNVCLVGPVKLLVNGDGRFELPFARIVCIRVHEPPRDLLLRIEERFGETGLWHHLTDILIPLFGAIDITSNDGNSKKSQQIDFISNLQRGSYNMSHGCGQPGMQNLSGRLFYRLSWINGKKESLNDGKAERKDTVPYQKIERASKKPVAPSLFPFQLVSVEEPAEKRGIESEWDFLNGMDTFETKAHVGRIGGVETSLLEVLVKAGQQYAMRLREHIFRSSEELGRRRPLLRELVREIQFPSLSEYLTPLFLEGPTIQMSRALKPHRNTVRSSTLTAGYPTSNQHHHTLLINIQSAHNLPQRAFVGQETSIFVQIDYQNQHVETDVVDGRHANWQETLLLDIHPDDLKVVNSSSEKKECAEMIEDNKDRQQIRFSLFDCRKTMVEGDDREKQDTVYRTQRNWLGSASISLKAILRLKCKVDGHLPLNIPIFSTGYKFEVQKPTIKLLMAIDPPPEISHEVINDLVASVEERMPLNESDPKIISDCIHFQQRIQRDQQRNLNRDYFTSPFVINSSGKRILASSRVQPPVPVLQLAANGELRKAAYLASHTVSAIPTIQNRELGRPPIWMTISEVLEVGCGSAEEHAMLLACWLLGLGLVEDHVALLFGPSLSSMGASPYVLLRLPIQQQQYNEGEIASGIQHRSADPSSKAIQPTQMFLIDAISGAWYSKNSAYCPLLSISMAVTSENLYRNIQNIREPWLMSYNFKNANHWDLLISASSSDFGQRINTSVQLEVPIYKHIEDEEDSLIELRTFLERRIKLSFDESRPHRIPQWNLLASRILRQFLQEHWLNILSGRLNRFSESHGLDQQPSADPSLRLEHQLQGAFQVQAIAFEIPFVSTESVVQAVLETNMHLNSEGSQFALAVHLQSLGIGPSLFSCSIALASLTIP